MQEPLISEKVAKLAREKGFDLIVNSHYSTYDNEGNFNLILRRDDQYVGKQNFNKSFGAYIAHKDEILYSAPTQSLLQTWLRDKHKIHIEINPNFDNEGDEEESWTMVYYSRFDNSLYEDAFKCISSKHYKTFEEALEQGLYETLKLIKE
jgi:hypothetical protein